jgi:hypothetical protein
MAELEQVVHDLEQRYVSLRHEYELVLVDRDTYKGNYYRIHAKFLPCIL